MQSSLYNISYIVYFTWSIYKEYRPSVCVLGCDIALGPAALGLYHILGHTLQVYIFVYRPGSILYTYICVYVMMKPGFCCAINVIYALWSVLYQTSKGYMCTVVSAHIFL